MTAAGRPLPAAAPGAAVPAVVPAAGRLPTPTLRRRLASLLYESLLLFGVSLIPAVVGAALGASNPEGAAWHADTALRAFALVVFAAYFVGFWSTRGQTLAMQTWSIRVEREDGSPLGRARASLRFLACCIGWFGPATLAVAILQPRPWPSLGVFAVGVVCWALLALLAPDRQFWHDRLCRTRLVDARKTRLRDSSVG